MGRQESGILQFGRLKDAFSERERRDVLVFGIASSDEYSESCVCRGSPKLAVPAVFAVF